MMNFVDRWLDVSARVPEKLALRCGSEQYTFGELDELSGRIAEYLKNRGIGRDDFVMIHMRRSALMVVAMLAVWRAGAAFTVCESTMPEKRVNAIAQDCRCRLTLNEKSIEEARNSKVMTGCVKTAPHDAAYAVYTSGSMGAPKGVIHEYGKLELILKVDANADYDHVDQVMGLIAPMSTVVAILLLVPMMINEGLFDVVPNEVLRDPRKLMEYIWVGKIKKAFFPPSLLKLIPKLPPCMDTVFAGSERAEGIYREDVRIFNSYAMSETGFTPLYHVVQKGERLSPAGVSYAGLEVLVVDENGKPVQQGETGELVLENPYTRGYIRSELNEGVFKGNYLYTGDIARMNEKNEAIVLGRRDEMIKIHGNRIEPAEIEAAVREVLGVPCIAARGFESENGAYVCAYLRAGTEFNAETLRERLKEILPSYMIPAYFIELTNVPLRPNGKVDRMALPAPETQKAALKGTSKSSDPLVTRICNAFAKVLHMESVSENAEFSELGGDSLRAMEIITECPEIGSIEVLIRGNSPKHIAEMVRENPQEIQNDVLHERAEAAKLKPHALNALQRYALRYQMETYNSTMWNLPMMARFDLKKYSPEQVRDAIEAVIKAHPSLATVYCINRGGEIEQRWQPELVKKTEIVTVSEAEIDALRSDLVRPFDLFCAPLQRSKIFVTEKSGYIFWDFHHSIADGYSLKQIREDFLAALKGEAIQEDFYYLNLEEDAAAYGTTVFREAKSYFEALQAGDDWCMYPAKDHTSRENRAGSCDLLFRASAQNLEALRRHYNATNNELCMAAFLLAVSQYNRNRNVKGCYVYHGRNDMRRQNTVGFLFRIMPIVMRFAPDKSVQDVLAEIRRQNLRCSMYNAYPFALDMFDAVTADRASCFYQSDVYNVEDVVNAGFEPCEVSGHYAASNGLLDTSIYEDADGLHVHIDYSASVYEPASMDRFIHMIVDNLEIMISEKPENFKLEY